MQLFIGDTFEEIPRDSRLYIGTRGCITYYAFKDKTVIFRSDFTSQQVIDS
jgi:hypothetical protein